MHKIYAAFLFISITNFGMEKPPARPLFPSAQEVISPTISEIPRNVKMRLFYQLAEDEFRKKNGKLRNATRDMRALFFTCKAYARFMYDDDATGWFIAHLIPVATKRWDYINERGHRADIDAAVALRTVSSGRDLVRRLNNGDDGKQMKGDRWAATCIFWRYLMSNKLSSSVKIAHLNMLSRAGCYPQHGTFGVTPLMVAIRDADTQLATFFFGRGVDLSLSTVNSETAENLLKACKKNAKRENNRQKIQNLKTIESLLLAYKTAHPQVPR